MSQDAENPGDADRDSFYFVAFKILAQIARGCILLQREGECY